MPLSDSQVKALKAGPGNRTSVGDSLLLVIESETRV